MIVVPAIVMIFLILALLAVSANQASNSLLDVANAASAEYEPHGCNLTAVVFALIVLALLFGAIGVGPLAGRVVTP